MLSPDNNNKRSVQKGEAWEKQYKNEIVMNKMHAPRCREGWPSR